MNFNHYFKRQIELWGKERQNSLKNKSIIIIGAGGLGSSLSFALGSSGIGRVDIVDFDKVSLHNIHRQIAFNLDDENNYKADVVSRVIKSKSPYVQSKAFIMKFDKFSQNSNIKYDLILDATDNLPSREFINRYAKSNNIPWIYASVEEFNGQICFFDKSSFSVFNISEHKPKGISAPMVMQIASIQANMAIRYLVGLKVDKDKLYYIFYNKNGELITQKFGMPID
jgi:adenylyltransferase/sulfurtransferase